jgi:hypothetical protein
VVSQLLSHSPSDFFAAAVATETMICWRVAAAGVPIFSMYRLKRLAASGVLEVFVAKSLNVALSFSFSSGVNESSSSAYSLAAISASAVQGNATPQLPQYAGTS